MLNKDPKFWGVLICGIDIGWWACTLFVIIEEKSRPQNSNKIVNQKLREWIESHPGESIKMEWNRTVPDPEVNLP